MSVLMSKKGRFETQTLWKSWRRATGPVLTMQTCSGRKGQALKGFLFHRQSKREQRLGAEDRQRGKKAHARYNKGE